jgi:PAS domain S-box-containing protein
MDLGTDRVPTNTSFARNGIWQKLIRPNKKLGVLIFGAALILMTTTVVMGLSIWILYESAYQRERSRLIGLAQSQARAIEDLARTEKQTDEVGSSDRTLAQVERLHEQYADLGGTGEFVLATRQGDQIVFLMSHGRSENAIPKPEAWQSVMAEPMRRALTGLSGVVVALDYRAVTVMAAYKPIPSLNSGFVAKIDLAEIRGPYIKAGLVSGLGASVIIVLGLMLFLWVSGPILERDVLASSLRENEQRFQDFAQSASDWHWELNPDLRYTFVSDTVTHITNRQPDWYSNLTLNDIIDRHFDRDEWQPFFDAFDARCAFNNLVVRRVDVDGSEKWISLNGLPVFDAEGNFECFRGTASDVSEIIKIQESLRRSEARFRDFAEAASDWFWETDAGHTYTDVSGRFTELTGIPVQDMIGRNRHEILKRFTSNLPKNEVNPLQINIRDMEAHRSFRDLEISWERENGELGVFLVSGQPMFDENQKFLGYRGAGRDITQHKRAELELEKSEKRYLEMFNRAQVGLARTRISDAKVLEANEQIARIYGYESREDLLTRISPISHWINPADRDRVLGEGLRSGGVSHSEVQHVRNDGSKIWVRLSASYYPELGYIETTNVDITKEKEVEAALGRMNEKLEELVAERTAELEAAQADLVKQERLATLGQLTATVAHEIRNPLSAIVNSVAVIKHKCREAGIDIQKALDRTQRSIDRCNNFITELLDFARAKGHQPKPGVLDAWLASVLAEIEIPDRVTVRSNYGTEGLVTSFDQEELRRAVINVVDNAWQAMVEDKSGESDTLLTVSTSIVDRSVEMTFCDTGQGVSADDVHRILEPLFSTKQFGTGLGLPTVQRIMERHGGGINIVPNEPNGACVILTLPISDGEVI